MSKDYYKTLGVSKSATQDEIKKAYRKLAMTHHPDRNPGNAESEKKFKEASEAYEILGDPQKRQQYDQFGDAAFANGGAGGFNGFNGFGGAGGFNADIFGDIFNDFFGGGQQQKASMSSQGNDVRYDVSITLEEAFKGVSQAISYHVNDTCKTCDGQGSKNKNDVTDCATCRGQGRIRMQQGFFMIEQTCHNCGGVGKIVKNPCAGCRGQGRVYQQKTANVNIPAGIDEGVRVRVPGFGEAGLRGGASGDLYVYVNVKPHKVFRRVKGDLICTMPIPMVDCALGCEVQVPLIEGGHQLVTIPAGTQHGAQIRVRSKGMSVMNKQTRGDMIIDCQVEVPVNLSETQQAQLRQFKEESKNRNNNPNAQGFFAKVKSWFG